MSDPVRRDILAALVASVGVAALASAPPVLAQQKRKVDERKPRPGAPKPAGRIETKVDFDLAGKFTGRALYGQLQEHLILQTAGSAGATGKLIISAVHGGEVACWVSKRFALTEGSVRLYKSGCSIEPSIFTETTDWLTPADILAAPYSTGRPMVDDARSFMSRQTGGNLGGASQGFAVMLLPDAGDVACNVAQFYGSIGIDQTADPGDNRGYARPRWSLPAI
jgi:hypothetical protein